MRWRYAVPAADHIKPSQAEAFGRILRDKLLAKDSPIAKSYLALLVDEIVVTEKEATMTGSHTAVASTLRVIAGARWIRCPASCMNGAHRGTLFEPDFGRFGRLVRDLEEPST